ncbi:tRNA pseudouridine(38-40) synthase TruA [Vreelandella venusta]|uniref:tRNA pseudouridine synthase A n=1 Tax=Vreelandella venusta TaxID=44935 RepID=A0AAQ0CI26_9GAMM|nr:tRNA pseudouridine(38-40) synthase TruA [Halomonas venusta]MBR9926628.1 tRNA pseudouridine(38-40) synthase TruA [Gammaproteobacteria bacterium]AZM95698.1 tRNA pseudouridine(38-40) synthase TruA [Halomonas venusta]MDW0361443.1 tRNA pseudouridine(38-40) synthase TruA [Halomonas venusta]MDX1712461.1 tRNA pseudouridine(38-40) synthase TruA [Halomonas venusta]NPT32182.1 tRNA pseudouridine(38-40) synthase TruA [Halomonas venusta]
MTLFYHFDETKPLTGRLAMGIEYDGTRFCGFQRLKHAASVQQAVEDALEKVASAPVRIHASGRTDSGVHATRQIIHFDPPVQRSEKAWIFGSNTNLPRDVAVRWVKPVSDDFHSRLGALGRRYRYILLNQLSRPVLERHNVTWCRDPLDADAMHRAAQALVGEHDFSSFRAAGCQSKTPWRQMHFVEVKRYGPIVVIDIQGNAFLHHMIRNIAGALVSVGRGSQDEGHIERLLALKNRRKGDVTAPACGLHFVDSLYDERFDLPKEPLGPNLLAFTGEWTGERQLPDNPRIAARRKLTFNSQAPLNQPEPAPSEQQETPL